MADIKITLETLYDILRNEKKKDDLQQLDESFFIDVVSYLREKNVLLEMKKEDDDIFAAGEKDKLEYELRSIKRILKEIYEKREKKIIDIALNRSKTGSDIIDTSAMLREEKKFYEEMLLGLDRYRKGVLINLFNARLPDLTDQPRIDIHLKKSSLSSLSSSSFSSSPLSSSTSSSSPSSSPSTSPSSSSSLLSSSTSPSSSLSSYGSSGSLSKTSVLSSSSSSLSPKSTAVSPSSVSVSPVSASSASDAVIKSNKISDGEMTKIRFTHPMPSFIWKDMKTYGPFDIGEELTIYPEVADLIVRKGRAEKVS